MKHSFQILNSFVDSVAIIDCDGNIIFTNDAWKNFSIENSGSFDRTDCGTNYLQVCDESYPSESAKEAAAGIRKVIKAEIHFFEIEYPCNSPDEIRWFMLRCNQLQHQNEFSIISHINITKRKLAEQNIEKRNEDLKEINKRLHTSIFKIAHDIQGPLNSIEGLLDLSRRDESQQSIDTYFSLIGRSVNHLKEFINTTLELSTSSLQIEPVDFKETLDEFIESIQYSNVLKQVEIQVQVNQQTEFRTYKSEIISVFSNLISNGLKYYDKNKKHAFVLVTITSTKSEAVVSVKDNGIGINDNDLENIFNLNYQVNKNSRGGFGVGLSLTKKSIETMKGQISVSSKLGVGTEFIFTIPNLNPNQLSS